MQPQLPVQLVMLGCIGSYLPVLAVGPGLSKIDFTRSPSEPLPIHVDALACIMHQQKTKPQHHTLQ